jgi:glucokinase
MATHLLGFDIGGTKCAVVLAALADDAARPIFLGRRVFATAGYDSPESTLDALVGFGGELMAEAGIQQVAAAGVSCGGPLNSRNGMILSPPNLPGWDRVPVTELLEARLHIPVRLKNDANACALAEWQWGAARGANTAVFLTFGTGLGAGLIIDGRLYEGPDDLAGEIGHWRMADNGQLGFGKEGSLEGFCSGGGMARLARERVREQWKQGAQVSFCSDEEALAKLDVRALAAAARRGDPLALNIFKTAGEKLGAALALLTDLLNPEVIVIGSIFTRAEDLLRSHVESVLNQEALPAAAARCQVRAAELGEQIGDYAAVSIAMQAKHEQPNCA